MLFKYSSLALTALILILLLVSCNDKESAFDAVHSDVLGFRVKHIADPILLNLKEDYPKEAKFFFYTPNSLDDDQIQTLSEMKKKLMNPNYKKLIINLSTEEFENHFWDGFYAVAVVSEGKVKIIKINSWFDKLMNNFYL